MRLRSLKYATPFVIYAGAFYSFHTRGWMIFLPLLYAWVFIPLVELFIPPDSKNLQAAEEEMVKKDPLYDLWLYLVLPLQYTALAFFLLSFSNDSLAGWEIAGRIAVMGLLCGVFGINVAHELGHRATRYEQFMAKALLLTSLYMHFFIEHNKGHHKNVSTPEDPGSARYGESLYRFFTRTIIYSYLSAWKIAGNDMRKKGLPAFHWRNEMVQFQLIQLIFVLIIYFLSGLTVTLYFLAAAVIGILLLETVNYIEHYGLQRRKKESGQYERAMPVHSWNSNQVIGRMMLFELSRHSDHHYLASRKYQLLRNHEEAPQMPTGYPGMMLLALVPPLWFYVMNRRISRLHLFSSA